MKKYLIITILLVISLSGIVFSAELPEYSIANIEDLSYSAATRFEYTVVVSGEPTMQKVKDIAENVVERAKSNKNFNALIVGFYDYEEYIESAYTLGKVTFAPQGKWDKANTVSSGDYSEMSYKYELKKKDWNKKLTEKEAKIWSYFDNLLWNSSLSEDEIAEKTSEKFNISPEKAVDIYKKQTTWTFSNLNN